MSATAKSLAHANKVMHSTLQPNLVRVMSVILRFTPQELRRLNAKVNS